jgi:hypothetical protein
MKETPAEGAWQKKFDYNYLGTDVIGGDGRPVSAVISKVTDAQGAKVQGQAKNVVLVYFNEYKKPMILNKTNAKTLGWNFGTNEMQNWAGKKVSIFSDPDVDAFGQKVEALRFVKEKMRGKFTPVGQVEKKARLEVDSPNFETIKAWLIETPEHSIETTTKKYDVSPEALEELKKAKDGR